MFGSAWKVSHASPRQTSLPTAVREPRGQTAARVFVLPLCSHNFLFVTKTFFLLFRSQFQDFFPTAQAISRRLAVNKLRIIYRVMQENLNTAQKYIFLNFSHKNNNWFKLILFSTNKYACKRAIKHCFLLTVWMSLIQYCVKLGEVGISNRCMKIAAYRYTPPCNLVPVGHVIPENCNIV